MRQQLTQTDKLKYWIDSEVSFTRVLLLIILFQLVEGTWPKTAIIVYGVFSLLYAVTRIAYVSSHDPDYLKVPKK